ncbi:MAG TPA: TonB-dependent receptor [Xanthomonadales bacterium]|nr:TonB-dependent receptor [Xanthomonadales bacterium]
MDNCTCSNRYLSILALAVFSCPLMPETAVAQEGSALEEIIVTATKRDVALQDVPITVSVFTEDDINRQHIVRPQDFINQVSNVTLTTAVRPGESNVSMRGIQGNFGLTQPVAVVVDGVVAANPQALDQELVGIEQIEVVKGPQSALYGRNANAGAIVISTKRPSDEFEGKALVGFGNGDSFRAQALVSGPLADNVFARLAVSHNERDGFWDNRTTGEPADFHEQQIIDGRVIFEPSDSLTIDLRAKASSMEMGSQLWSVQVPPFIPVTNNDYFPTYEMNNNLPGEQDRYDFSAKIDWDISLGTLTFIGSYDDFESQYSADGALHTIFPGGPPTIFVNPNALLGLDPPAYPGYSRLLGDGNAYAELDQSDTTLELRLTSPSDQPFRWFAGAYYADSTRLGYSDTRVDTGAGVIYEKLGPGLVAGGTNTIIAVAQYQDVDIEDYAFFGQVEYDLTDQFTFEVSMRYDDETVENINLIPTGNSPVTGRPLTDPVAAPSGLYREDSFSEVQPRVALRYQPNDNLTIFGSYGRGFRSGGFNGAGLGARVKLQAPNTNFPDNYPGETSDAYELGFKSQWLDGRVQLNGAVFYTDIDDAQAFTAFPSPPITIVISLEKVHAEGAELELVFQVTDMLRVSDSYGFTDTEIEQSQLPTSIGKEIPGTPDYTNTFNVDFDVPITSGMSVVAHADWQMIGSMWFDVYNTPLTQRESLGLLNGRIALIGSHQDNTWEVGVWGRNLTDKFYNIYSAPVLPIGNFSYRAAPRSYGVDLVYRF